jgi:hypothetical protein
MRIDVDINNELANSASLIGSPETCIETPLGAPVDVDVTVSAIPAVVAGVGGLIGYDFNLNYSPSQFRVIGLNGWMLLGANSGSQQFSLGDPVPDSDGIFRVAVTDSGSSTTPESGAGVLARITLESLATGLSNINLLFTQSGNLVGAGAGGSTQEYFVNPIGATIAVDTSCP